MKRCIFLFTLIISFISTAYGQCAEKTEPFLLRIADKIDTQKKLSKKERASLLEIFDTLSTQPGPLLESALQLIINGITNKTIDKKALMAEMKRLKNKTPLHEGLAIVKPADQILADTKKAVQKIRKQVKAQQELTDFEQLTLLNALDSKSLFPPPLPPLSKKNKKIATQIDEDIFKIITKGIKNGSIRKDLFLHVVAQAHGLDEAMRKKLVEHIENQKELSW